MKTKTPGQTGSSLGSHVVQIIAAVLGALAGAFGNHYLALAQAPQATEAGTRTLYGLARNTLQIATLEQVSSDLLDHIRQLEQQAKAVEVNLKRLDAPAGEISSQADFWLRPDKGVTLGGTTTFGVQGTNSAQSLVVVLNGYKRRLSVGSRVDFQTQDNRKCFMNYIGKAPEGELYGFKINCQSQKPG